MGEMIDLASKKSFFNSSIWSMSQVPINNRIGSIRWKFVDNQQT